MKTFVALFVVSALFGLTIGVTYFFVAHEWAGTSLLAVMTAALVFAAAYAVLAERDADLTGDRPEAGVAVRAGEDLGIFTKHTPWPILIALSALGALTGTLWSPFVAVVSLAALVFCLWRLGAESAEV
jgi:cytochrome c oxidase subunit IV